MFSKSDWVIHHLLTYRTLRHNPKEGYEDGEASKNRIYEEWPRLLCSVGPGEEEFDVRL